MSKEEIDFWLGVTAIVSSSIVMIGGGLLVYDRLKAKEQGFGPSSLKALGIILFLPALIIIGVAVADFKSETIAALLGTVAGYVLSHSKKDSE
uniref:Uncharacterized protein n=1 Tax=Hydrogenovibrio crunogenus (strain DSM 25203 / XCL-2) TaxID=317025 RepID=Q31IQ9_HYDCU